MFTLKKITLITFFGLFSFNDKAMENGAVIDPVAFGRQVLSEWGFRFIEHSFFGPSQISDVPVRLDSTSTILAKADNRGITFGADWKKFADNPDMIRAILGHEAMHILNGDPCNMALDFSKNILPYIFRGLESYLYTQGLSSIADATLGPEETNNPFSRTALISLIMPISLTLLKHFSSSNIFDTAKIAQSKDPQEEFVATFCLTTANIILTIASALIGTPSFYQNIINTLVSYVQSISSFFGLTIEPLVKTATNILTAWIIWWILKRLVLYPAFAHQRAAETAADLGSARKFGVTQQALIALFTRMKELWPKDNIFSPLDTHPTPDARIAALQSL